ncbi:MAG: hypothetical protein ACJ740_06995 [Gaiellales bacterium]|jgi:hypothetical protein
MILRQLLCAKNIPLVADPDTADSDSDPAAAASPAGQVKDAPEPTTSASQAWWWRDGSSGQ